MGKFSRANEQAFYLRNTTGVTGQTPWDQLQRTYYTQYLNDATTNAQKVSLQDLQIRWMKKWLLAHSGTPPVGSYESNLWELMVIALGIVPAKQATANQFTFFANATS